MLALLLLWLVSSGRSYQAGYFIPRTPEAHKPFHKLKSLPFRAG
jgi:hypothetical protein